MRSIYIDNVRGFTDTYIPIKDVNFLVGENSTGKTTILEIINLLSDQTFCLTQNFDNVKELRFRSFQSIVNINSQDKSYFSIGTIEHQNEVKDEQSRINSAFLLTFINQNEIPVVSEYYCITGKYEIKVIFHEDYIMYKVNSVDQLSDADTYQLFKDWTNHEIKNSEEYRKIIIQSTREYQFSTIITLIENKILENLVEGSIKGSISSISLPVGFPMSFLNFTKIKLIWLAPIRSKPRPTYDDYNTSFSPEGDHIPYLLKRILNNKSLSPRFLELLNIFGKDSGLFDSIGIKEFGKDPDSPFEVDVVINDNPIAISEVGYGVPQALPIIIELLARQKGTWYAIQQPEIHLHPRAQAALGELFYLMAIEEEKRFFIETHSDYIIDRFRLSYQKYDQKDIDSQVLYFEKTPIGNKVYPIEIEKTGQYSEEQPSTFREFFIKEAIALLEV